MTKFISVPKKMKKEIEAVFGCSRVTVWSALNYKTGSERAKRIRKFAIDKGGVIYDSTAQKSNDLNS
jgi:hypothetical protein